LQRAKWQNFSTPGGAEETLSENEDFFRIGVYRVEVAYVESIRRNFSTPDGTEETLSENENFFRNGVRRWWRGRWWGRELC